MRSRGGIRGYQGYRGRGRGNGHKWLIALLVLVLAAACAFLFAQRYVVYSSDGSMHYEWPWARRSEPAGDDAQTGDAQESEPVPELVIEGSDPQPIEPAPTVTPEPTPEPTPPADEPMRAVELPASALQGSLDKALQDIGESGANALAIRVKNSRGQLLYPSAIDGAIRAQAVSGSSIALSAIEELTGGDRPVIARISALHDSIYSFAHMSDAAIQQVQYSGYIWYAPDSTFYLAPEKELARQYLADIARECAELGFDELLFDEFAYPSEGRLSNIKTNARTMTKEEALTLLASELKAAVEDSGVKLSLVLDAETVLAGGDEVKGQSLAALAPYFDRIYVPATAEQIPALEDALADLGVELAVISTEPVEGHPYLIGR